MTIKLMALALLSLTLSACSSRDLHAMKMEDILNSYGSAIRFGEFEKAADFQNPTRRPHLDESWLKNIHVSSYDPLYRKEEEGSNILEQTVEIRYFNESVGVEKIITDRQLWRYYEDKHKWMLETDLPTFR